jgi:hypothetical protein
MSRKALIGRVGRAFGGRGDGTHGRVLERSLTLTSVGRIDYSQGRRGSPHVNSYAKAPIELLNDGTMGTAAEVSSSAITKRDHRQQ